MDKSKIKHLKQKILLSLTLFPILFRMSGGGFWVKKWLPEKLNMVPELLLAGFLSWLTLDMYSKVWDLSGTWSWWGVYLFVLSWVYGWMQTGHGTALSMGRDPSEAQGGRKQTLSAVVDPISKWFGWELGGFEYSWFFFGVKGFLIGLPLFPLGAVILALLLPLAYEVGAILKETDFKNEPRIGGIVQEMLGGLAVAIAYSAQASLFLPIIF